MLRLHRSVQNLLKFHKNNNNTSKIELINDINKVFFKNIKKKKSIIEKKNIYPDLKGHVDRL
jgi:hypothetical protein